MRTRWATRPLVLMSREGNMVRGQGSGVRGQWQCSLLPVKALLACVVCMEAGVCGNVSLALELRLLVKGMTR
jgi:hypothetical protein